jgi:hypothetical protein
LFVSRADSHHVTQSIGRYNLQSLFTAIFKHQLNRGSQIVLSFLWSATLTICFRHFRTLRNKPITVALNERSELVVHRHSLS